MGVRQGKSHLKMGIVGLPNVGKTTLFNALTHQSLPAENFPFCTIDPAVSRVSVPDTRLDALDAYFEPKAKKEAFLTVTDIAGLVKGASEGAGLGNSFLSTISSVDGIYHVVRGFGGNHVAHVEGGMDILRDIDIIETELRYKDRDHLEKLFSQATRKGKADTKKELLENLLELIRDGKMIRSRPWNSSQVEAINSMGLLTAKPMVYLLNLSEEDYLAQKHDGKELIEKRGEEIGLPAHVVPYCAEIEEMVMSMGEDGSAYSEVNNFTSALPDVIHSGFNALNLMQYFTVGKDEVRAWPVRRGAGAPEAAGCIHTDFEKAFQTVEVVKFEEFLAHKAENPTYKPLKFSKFGKKYIVEDGDILQFVTTLKK